MLNFYINWTDKSTFEIINKTLCTIWYLQIIQKTTDYSKFYRYIKRMDIKIKILKPEIADYSENS